MCRNQNWFTTRLVRAGFVAVSLTFGLWLTLSEAHASKVCAPDGRGCYYTREKCGNIDIPARWTCSAILAVDPKAGDRLVHEKDGRAVVMVKDKKIYIISDALESQFALKKPTADEFARQVLEDRGAVSDETIQRLSKELGLRVVKDPGKN